MELGRSGTVKMKKGIHHEGTKEMKAGTKKSDFSPDAPLSPHLPALEAGVRIRRPWGGPGSPDARVAAAAIKRLV